VISKISSAPGCASLVGHKKMLSGGFEPPRRRANGKMRQNDMPVSNPYFALSSLMLLRDEESLLIFRN